MLTHCCIGYLKVTDVQYDHHQGQFIADIINYHAIKTCGGVEA
jgi:hypothetical protein